MKWGRIEVQGRPLRVAAEGDTLVGEDGTRHSLAGARFLPPAVPPNFYAAGLNFRAHIEWANQHHGGSYKVPTQADIGYRSNNALVGHGADIVIPADSTGPVEFEGELVAVIGRQARHVSEDDALRYVAGYTLGNDVSEHLAAKRPYPLARQEQRYVQADRGRSSSTGSIPWRRTSRCASTARPPRATTRAA